MSDSSLSHSAKDALEKAEHALWVLRDHNHLHFGHQHSTVAEAQAAWIAVRSVLSHSAAPLAGQGSQGEGCALPTSAPSADLGTLMAEHGISVWMDPDWWNGSGLPRWLAGKNIRAVEGTYYSTLTGSDPSSIEADHTCNGATPLEAVLAVIAKATGEGA